MKEIKIQSEFIKLDAFMKWADIVSSGAEAKMLIQDEMVIVNGEIETRRGKKLIKNDIIEIEGEIFKII